MIFDPNLLKQITNFQNGLSEENRVKYENANGKYKSYLRYADPTFIDLCAALGHLEIIKHTHVNGKLQHTLVVSAWAAENGHLDVVKWLYDNGHEGCIELTIDSARRFKQLEILEWLEHNIPIFPNVCIYGSEH